MWTKSFGADHVIPITSVKKKLEAITKAYFNRVYSATHRKKPKNAGETIKNVSLRMQNKIWRNSPLCISDSSGKRGRVKKANNSDKTNNHLLDIGKDMDTLKGREEIFYKDQLNERECRLSEEIDTEYEEEKENQLKEQEENEALEEQEMSFINAPEFSETYTPTQRQTILHTPTSSALVSSTPTSEVGETPTSSISEDRPPIRKTRNVLPHVKDAIATTSYEAAISIDKARVAFKVIAKKMYGHRYYLSKEEQAKYEPSLDPIMEINETDEISEPKSKRPRSSSDYKAYRYVLPDRRMVSDFKHNKAMQQEITAANALANKPESTRVTLHYDTTSRCRIYGEWPSIIFNFLDDDKEKCEMFNLRALEFAYEDRKQIAKLIVETLKRLSVATGGKSSATELWCKVYAFMTDATTKNLEVETLVSEMLGTDYVPLHILCKSHTCEKLDECCIDALVEIEKKIKLADTISKRQPRLKSFI